MPWFVSKNGDVYHGMRKSGTRDEEIPERPDIGWIWGGAEWIQPSETQDFPTDIERLEAVEAYLYGRDGLALPKAAQDMKARLIAGGKDYGGT